MTPQMIVALLIAACSFGTAWKVQDWRYDAKENQRAQQELVDQRNSANTAIRRLDVAADAVNERTERETRLRADADSARAQLGGMRGTLSRTLRDAATSQAACLDRATTLSELLTASETEYLSVAEKAGRHANDAATCLASYPK